MDVPVRFISGLLKKAKYNFTVPLPVTSMAATYSSLSHGIM